MYIVNICCSDWLINKDYLAYEQAKYNEVGKPNRDTGRKKAQSGSCQQLLEKQDLR